MCQTRCQLVLLSSRQTLTGQKKISIEKNKKKNRKNIFVCFYLLIFYFYLLIFFELYGRKKKLSCHSDHPQRASFALRMY